MINLIEEYNNYLKETGRSEENMTLEERMKITQAFMAGCRCTLDIVQEGFKIGCKDNQREVIKEVIMQLISFSNTEVMSALEYLKGETER